MRRHTIRLQPVVKKRREAADLVLIDEDRIRGLTLAAQFTEFGGERLQRLIPRNRDERAIFARHRPTESIRIVQPLQRRLSLGTQCTAVQLRVRIAFDLERPTVARLDQNAARRCALATGAGEVVGHTGNGVIGTRHIRDQLLHMIRAASRHGSCRGGNAEDLEEVAAFDANRSRLSAHAVVLNRETRDRAMRGA